MVYSQELVDKMFRMVRMKTDYGAMMADMDGAIRRKIEENRTKERAFGEPPAGVTVTRVDVPECPCWWITGEGNPDDRVLFYIHGGGFIGGSTAERNDFVFHAAKQWGINVFSVDYRLAPEFRAPVPTLDCLAAYRYLLKTCPDTKVAVFGESAGGCLVLTTLHAALREGLPMPRCAAANSPIIQGDVFTDSWYRNDDRDNIVYMASMPALKAMYVDEDQMHDPLVWPKYGDFRGFPPTLVEVSDAETLYDDGVEAARLLKEAGVDVTLKVREGLLHAYLISPGIEGYLPIIEELGAWLCSHLR